MTHLPHSLSIYPDKSQPLVKKLTKFHDPSTVQHPSIKACLPIPNPLQPGATTTHPWQLQALAADIQNHFWLSDASRGSAFTCGEDKWHCYQLFDEISFIFHRTLCRECGVAHCLRPTRNQVSRRYFQRHVTSCAFIVIHHYCAIYASSSHPDRRVDGN